MKKVLLVHHLPEEVEASAMSDFEEQLEDLMDIIEDAPGKAYDLSNSELLIYFPEASWDEMHDDYEIRVPGVWDN